MSWSMNPSPLTNSHKVRKIDIVKRSALYATVQEYLAPHIKVEGAVEYISHKRKCVKEDSAPRCRAMSFKASVLLDGPPMRDLSL